MRACSWGMKERQGGILGKDMVGGADAEGIPGGVVLIESEGVGSDSPGKGAISEKKGGEQHARIRWNRPNGHGTEDGRRFRHLFPGVRIGIRAGHLPPWSRSRIRPLGRGPRTRLGRRQRSRRLGWWWKRRAKVGLHTTGPWPRTRVLRILPAGEPRMGICTPLARGGGLLSPGPSERPRRAAPGDPEPDRRTKRTGG